MDQLKENIFNMHQNQIEFVTLGDEAIGTIEPLENNIMRLEEFTERVGSGEFHVNLNFDESLSEQEIIKLTIVAGCIDGRRGCSLKANSAGGTESLMVADDLTNQQFRSNDHSTAGAYANVVSYLRMNGFIVGGHDGSHASTDGSGCGANDKLKQIYQVISSNNASIRQLVEQLGIIVSNETHDLITTRASERDQFSSGADILSVLKDIASESAVDNLEGEHNEVLIVINKRYGTTLDREAIHEEFGDYYQAFNVDAWAFQNSANAVSTTNDSLEASQKVAAMAYYNIATALTLCGPNIRIVSLD